MGKTPVAQNITVKEAMLPYNSELSVGVTYDGKLKLKDNSDVTIGYKIVADGTDVTTNDTILTVLAGTPDAVTTAGIGGVLTEKPIYSGMYVNTATFVVSVS